MMQTLSRKKCCICSASDLKGFLNVPQFPIFMGTTSQSVDKDLFYDLDWVICDGCGCLQLSKLIPMELLYDTQHSSGTVGDIWKQHHIEFSKFIFRDNITSICEIGAGNCELASIVLKTNPGLKYLIIEPNPANVPNGADTIKGFIEDNFNQAKKFQSIVHSHVLEHVYNPQTFISGLASIMDSKSVMYVSFPNIEQLIKTRGTNSLNFEHTYFLHPSQLKSLLQFFGLSIIREQKYKDHSFFYKVVKSNIQSGKLEIPSIALESQTYKDLWIDLKKFVKYINQIIDINIIPTYVFGAHIFSQALLCLNLSTKNIVGVLDNSTVKQGQRLYGTSLKVSNPSVIKNQERVRVILNASHYQEEIRNQLLDINPNVEIIELNISS